MFCMKIGPAVSSRPRKAYDSKRSGQNSHYIQWPYDKLCKMEIIVKILKSIEKVLKKILSYDIIKAQKEIQMEVNQMRWPKEFERVSGQKVRLIGTKIYIYQWNTGKNKNFIVEKIGLPIHQQNTWTIPAPEVTRAERRKK